MKRKRLILFLVIGVLVLGVGYAVLYMRNKPRMFTFEECESMGGEAWLVDIYHPDICPACAEYRACELVYNDYSEVCPECYEACPACQDSYPYDSCHEDYYDSCRNCENEYLHDFEDDEEKYRLCPTCEDYKNCREEITSKRKNCPPCIACEECKEKNKKYTDIGEVCPQVTPCGECMSDNFPYPDQCPGGKESVGEISDAATWFLCCK